MRSPRALGGLMFFGALVLPFMAFADSQLATGAQGSLTATAHLRFRIIIPTMLSLDVADSSRSAAAQTVTVTSNSRNVVLGATVGNSTDATRHLVLSAAARKGIAQEASCAAQATRTAAGATAARPDSAPAERMVCTVSMP